VLVVIFHQNPSSFRPLVDLKVVAIVDWPSLKASASLDLVVADYFILS